MRDSLFSLRGIKSGERYMVLMLLAQALFLGIFIGAFDISAHSLFLAIFDEKMLAKGYIVSGLAGIILLSIYFFLQTRMKFRNFEFLNLITVTAIILFLWILLVNNPSKRIIFLVFIMLGPLNIISIIGFRTAAGAMFAHLKRNREYAAVDSSLIIGIIISCFSVPLLLTANFQLHNVLFISVIAIFISTLLQGIAGNRLILAGGIIDHQPDGLKSTVSVLNVFREDSYSRILGIFIVLSVVSAFFIQYSFLAVTRERFPAGEDMARFLGIFTGSIMIMTIAGKLLLFKYLMKNYGLKVCLTISPVLLAVFTAIAIAFGMILGYTRETASGFMIFFILLALVRFLSKSMDDSIESRSFKVLYQTIDEKVRFGVQSVMDSAVKEAAAFLAGLILAGIGVLSFINLIHFSWILIIILSVWLFVAFRLYSEYRISVKKGLESLQSEDFHKDKPNEPLILKGRFFGERAFSHDYFNLISGDLSLFAKINNSFYFKKIISHTGINKDINLLPLVKKMAFHHFDDDIRKQSADTVRNVEEPTSVLIKDDERLISAKKVLSETRMPQTTEILRLLKDKSLESKRIAIYMIGKFRLADMLPEVCECLNIPGLEADAAAVLTAFGNNAEENLIRFYLVSSGNINVSKTILRLLSRMPLNEGMGFLFSRLWSNSRQLKEVALKCLINCGFKPSAEEKERLNLLISDIVGIITWNLSAKKCLEENKDAILLKEVNKELKRWSTFLINILSITYDVAAITRIRRNLEFETIESVHHAHAIIDIIVDDSVKAKIIYLLDVIPDEEKLKNLNSFFPVEIPRYDKLLEDLLNRDYNLLSLWTKACVLRSLPRINDNEMGESVVALLFSPETLLQEESVRLIARSDIKLYRSVYNRKSLDRLIDTETDPKEFLFEKVQFLSQLFEGIIEEELLLLAKKMSFLSDIKTIMSLPPDGYIQWSLLSGNDTTSARIIFPGNLEEVFDKAGESDNNSGYYLSFIAIDEFLYQFPDNAGILLGYLEKNERLTKDTKDNA
jgi:AAA family ATP:ADP antiporter